MSSAAQVVSVRNAHLHPPFHSSPAELNAITAGDIVLTGDRPTGALHLGHYAGSLRSRIALQGKVAQTILIADLQALTDNAGRPAHVASHIETVALDYLAAGLDPALNTIAVQSRLPALAELTVLYLNLVTLARLERNPTVRSEIELRGFERDVPAGFLCYPVSQAADITGFRATIVPVGDDQLPMIEQTNEIIRRLNRMSGGTILPECRALMSTTPRLPGVDGRKASKSAGNAIPLSATPAEVSALVQSMYTDPLHLHVGDPGHVEGNVVFAHLDAFDPDYAAVAELKAHYQRGGLGDGALKQRLTGVLEDVLQPMRDRRATFAADRGAIRELLDTGTALAREVTDGTLADVRRAFALDR
jgi:tryptophanyl-tRNA synthetase